jgi:hypothetical protein
MFAQGTQRFATGPGATPVAAPPSLNGTLDEPVSDTLKRDLLRCAARLLAPRCRRSALTRVRLSCLVDSQGSSQRAGGAAAWPEGHSGRRGARCSFAP